MQERAADLVNGGTPRAPEAGGAGCVDAVGAAAGGDRYEFGADEAIALLGGASVHDLVAARLANERLAAIPAAVVGALAGPGQWLFAADPRRWPLEVLRQKLATFCDVVAGVVAVHAMGRPHLGITTGNLEFPLHGHGQGAPMRWRLQARLLARGSTAVAIAVDDGSPLLAPDAEMLGDVRNRHFVAPPLRTPDAATLTLPVSCYQVGSADGRGRFVIEATGAGVPRSYRGGDVVLVQPVAGGPQLGARLEEVRPRGLLASALLAPDHPCAAWDGTQFDARLVLYRRLGPAADLHGLGTLLLRLVLVDDEQGLDEVVETFGKCLRRLEDEPTAIRLEERSLAARLRQLLGARDARVCCEPSHLLHRRADRDAAVAAAKVAGAPLVDDGLWHRVLLLAARLLSTLPHFGYAQSLGDGDANLLPRVVADLQLVQQRLHVELFAAAERDEQLALVCGALLAEAGASNVAGRGNGDDDCFRLVVRKDGDAAVAEHRFTQERVTIGRREGDSVLRLNDAMVSSAHAVIERTPEGWCVMDRNSTNGTEVDGIRLPGEVPQPLQDGSVVHIRPFRLTFHGPSSHGPSSHGASSALDVTSFGPRLGADELWEQLQDAFAATVDAGAAPQQLALQQVLHTATASFGASVVHDQVELLRPRWLRRGGAAAAGAVAGEDAAIAAAAARAVGQLSRALLGDGEFRSAEEVQTFVGKLGRFVETTTQWIERTLELRKALGKHLDLGFASTASGRPPVRSAEDVRRSALGWASAAADAEPSAYFLARFYDDLMSILEGLLKGNQQVRRAVRERLDPARLVEAVSREARLRLLVQAAASSALWKAYVQAYQEVTDGGGYEAELDQLLQKAATERASP